MSDHHVIIRPAVAADVPSLGEMGALLVARHHAFDPKRFIAPGPGSARGYGAFLGGELTRADTIVLAAEVDGEVVGYAYGELEGHDWLSLRGPAGVIHDLVVSPRRQGQGIGRRLLDDMVRRLIDRGAPRVVLSAAYQNEGAQRLFASAGFRPTMVEMTREAEP